MRRTRFLSFLNFAYAALAFVGLSTNVVGAADNVTVVYNFSGGVGGGDPASGIVFDRAGNAYGTTVTGGASNCGTVFKLTPKAHGHWTQSVLHSFGCFADGKNPHGGVTLHEGNLYGTTVAGGSGGVCDGDGCGEVFELGPKGLNVVYNFKGRGDGFGPGSPVVFDTHGNLFGATPDGGAHASGLLYEISRKGARFQKTTIYSFTGKSDGGIGSLGALLLDKAGNIYGVTEVGGRYTAGTAYELSRRAGGGWQFDLLYAFRGQPDAGSPYGGLIPDSKGNVFGTTYYGGANGQGSIYELNPTARGPWSERVIYSFKGGDDGAQPTSTLAFDGAGNLYATTSAGGNPDCDCGAIVKLDMGTGRESVIHAFNSSPDGSFPYYGLTSGGNGNFYSTTVAGGSNGQGTIFGFTP